MIFGSFDGLNTGFIGDESRDTAINLAAFGSINNRLEIGPGSRCKNDNVNQGDGANEQLSVRR